MYENSERSRRRRVSGERKPKRRPIELVHPNRTMVVTILDRSIRGVVDGGTDGIFAKVHVDSIDDAARAVREHSASAILLSPSIVQRQSLADIAALVRNSPGVTAIAVLGEDWPNAHNALLDLGACGVRQVVNLGEREGWNQLRAVLNQTGSECGALLTREILAATEEATVEARHFFATVIRVAPDTPNVKALSTILEIGPSTLMSRFFRASLPAPKMYLSMTRLLYAAWFLEMPSVSVAATANALHFSSPQSFGRHVRTTLGLTAGQFRRELSIRAALDHYLNRLILPYQETLRTFRPIGSHSMPCRELRKRDRGRLIEGS